MGGPPVPSSGGEETIRLMLYEMVFKKWILPSRSTFLFET